MKPVKKEAVHGLKLEIKKIYHGVSRRDTRLPKQYGGQAELQFLISVKFPCKSMVK